MSLFSGQLFRRLGELIIFVAVMGVVPSAENSTTWDFDTDALGQIAKDFVNESGRWSVMQDGDNQVLAQHAERRLEEINLTLIANSSHKNLDVTVRIQAFAGENERGGGIVFRAQDKDNYYVARYNPYVARNNPRPTNNFRLYKVEKGVRTQLDHAAAPEDPLKVVPGGVPNGTNWHSLRITMQGNEIVGYLDGQKLLEAEDGTFQNAGQIGLWTKSDAQTRFDDLTVSTFDPSDRKK